LKSNKHAVVASANDEMGRIKAAESTHPIVSAFWRKRHFASQEKILKQNAVRSIARN